MTNVLKHVDSIEASTIFAIKHLIKSCFIYSFEQFRFPVSGLKRVYRHKLKQPKTIGPFRESSEY